MWISELAIFLYRSLRAPRRVGSVMPSSQVLAREMARHVDPNGDGLIVELGGGTGAITKALLEAGVAPERLVIVEYDKTFHRLLEKRFPETRVIHGDALHLTSALDSCQGQKIETTVSSLPMKAFPEKDRHRIIDQAFQLMGPEGAFVQYTYWFKSPANMSLLNGLKLTRQAAGHVWFNVPPATIWRYHSNALAPMEAAE